MYLNSGAGTRLRLRAFKGDVPHFDSTRLDENLKSTGFDFNNNRTKQPKFTKNQQKRGDRKRRSLSLTRNNMADQTKTESPATSSHVAKSTSRRLG